MLNTIQKRVGTSGCVNITMVTFNRLELSKQTLCSLRETTKDVPCILTVVDNGSSDGTQDFLLDALSKGIIDNYIPCARNMGAAVACNLGWSIVDAEYYLRIDNDLIFKGDWIGEMLFHINADKTIGIMSSAYFNKEHLIEKNTGYGKIVLAHRYNEITPGGCLLISKSTFLQLGFFCEDYGSYGPEDGDYSLRCDKLGLKRYYISDLNATTHIGIETDVKKNIQQKNTLQHHFRNIFYQQVAI